MESVKNSSVQKMNELAVPLVITKLRVPTTRPHIISRMRLLDRLSAEKSVGLTLVCAPAGYGKTTLLAEWAAALVKRGISVVWYALDPGDDDPIPFMTYLIASFLQTLGPIPELTQVAQLHRTSPEMDLQRIFTMLINAMLSTSQNCTLILDDYHLVSTPVIHSAISYLIEHRPDNLQIVIGSRSDPQLPLARLRARGRLLEIRTDDLRFTMIETVQFLNEVMQLELQADWIAALAERTEGWIAGLQLAALSLSGRPGKNELISAFTGSHRYLVEYLIEEVINRQPEEVRLFLRYTSILERMCAPLCDEILGTSSFSEEVLQYLEKANLFVLALDDQQYWYRYHHLFREFLQSQLNKTQPECVVSLHQTACEWLAANGFLREAAMHAFQTRDWEYAAAFVEQHNFTLIVHSDIATIYEWCSAFPETVMQQHPMLCIMQAFALAYNFRLHNRYRIDARLQQVAPIITSLKDPELSHEFNGLIMIVRTFQSMAPDPAVNLEQLLDIGQRMANDYLHEDPGRFSGLLMMGYAYMAMHNAPDATSIFKTARQIALREELFFGVVESTFHLARLAYSQGQLHQSAAICQQGQADIAVLLAHPELELPALGCLDIALGCVFLEQNNLEEAETHLCRGLRLMGWAMNPYYLMTAFIALFHLSEIQEQYSEAMKYLDNLDEVWPDIHFCTTGLRMIHALRQNPKDADTLAMAASWCQAYSPPVEKTCPPGIGPIGAAEAYYLANLAWCEAQIALGRPHAACSFIQQSLDLVTKYHLKTRLIELNILQGKVSQQAGDLKTACDAIQDALDIARPEGFVRIFVQDELLTHLIKQAACNYKYKEYTDQLLAIIAKEQEIILAPPKQMTRSDQPTQYPFTETLSQREFEILRLMAQGDTNQAIAEKLVITVGTVKSHINHILGKLDARNRTEAVVKARKYGIIEVG